LSAEPYALTHNQSLLYVVVSKTFRTDAVKIIKLTIIPIGRHHPRSSSLPHVDTGPTVSSIFGTLPGSRFLSVSRIMCDSAWISSVVSNRRPFSYNFIFGNRKKSQGAKSGSWWLEDDNHFVCLYWQIFFFCFFKGATDSSIVRLWIFLPLDSLLDTLIIFSRNVEPFMLLSSHLSCDILQPLFHQKFLQSLVACVLNEWRIDKCSNNFIAR
jgi:hypothetical protein